MTGRLRVIVRLLDIYADDLRTGTFHEQAVSVLLSHVAAIIVNGYVVKAAHALSFLATFKPRADRVAAEAEARVVEEDAAELEGEG
jgi:hypothetical protein